MRRWLLLVFVLLLPLRGWTGEAMAGQMLQHAAAGMQVHAAPAVQHEARTLHGHDCDDHGQAHVPAGQHGPAQSQADADCPTCASCQVCSAPALSPPPVAGTAPAFAHGRPHSIQRSYASAERALFFKPPRH